MQRISDNVAKQIHKWEKR